ncbi:hypothetical protein CLOP_g2875 [Closterium sp. NIES-67]|nr:hypothetical protein CLOP_g2875 [Closterium sp. NIES-67]
MREEEMLMEEELYLRRQMFEHIKDLVEADDSCPRAWKLLRDVIQPNTLPMVIVLEKELAAISMQPGDDVKPVLNKIKDTYARMAAAGSSVSQLQQCTKIISVMDNSWDNLIPTLNSQQDQWTPEWLRQQILQEDFRRRHVGGGAQGEGAQGNAYPGLFLMVENVHGHEGDVGSVGKVVMHPLTHWKSKAEVTFGPTSCRAKLGKKVLWSLEEETSCIKDLWQLPIIPWNGKTPTAATAAAAKATAGGDATAPTDGDHKGWLLWDLTTQKLTVSRDVKFLESLYYKEWKQQQQKLPSTPLIVEADEIEEDEIAHCYWAPIPEPKTREEALNGPNGEKWKASEDEEFGSLIENETWDLCDLPPGKKAITSKMIYRHKYGPEGELTRYKSRLVARGFQQTKGKEYDERKYCEGLAEKYGLQDGGKPATPLPSGFTVEPCSDEEVVGESDRKLFHSMVGSLNYAANHTRPDIAFATSRYL